MQKCAMLSGEPRILQPSIYCFSSLNIASKAVENIPNIAFFLKPLSSLYTHLDEFCMYPIGM